MLVQEFKDLTREEYDQIRELVYNKSGINLGEHKMQLVRARLGKIIRSGGYTSFQEYFNHVVNDKSGTEMSRLLDAISTNTTHLFRENAHFELLTRLIQQWTDDQKWLSENRELRIWSAASSSGEEPYSIAMTVHNALQKVSGVSAKILATDISTEMLSKANQGIFDVDKMGTVPDSYQKKYFKRISTPNGDGMQVVPELRQMLTFARFNLMTPQFPFKHGFHVVFCRNVMIYFDRQTQEALVNRISGVMKNGAHLMIGHSESLNAIQHPLQYVQPTVYRK